MSAWRLILGDGADNGQIRAGRGALNMAIDEALLESVRRSGQPVLRFYTWAPACLSLGRNQRAAGSYDPDRAAAAGVDIVRRPTGGLAVLHDRELTYSVAAPVAAFDGPRAAYAAINSALVDGLRALGVAAEQAAGGRVRGQQSTLEPCFQRPAAGEVVVGGRKLVGSAQRCEGGALLQHGSILIAGSQARILELLTGPASAPAVAADGSIALEDLLGTEPALPALVDAMRSGFERLGGTRLAPERLTREEHIRVEQLAARYAGAEWTWRR